MLSGLLCTSAHAYEIETGDVMICDTRQQVERFVELFDGNAQVALSTVNAEQNNPGACALANVAFVRGGAIGMARTMSRAFRIDEILVVGVNGPGGFRQVTPAKFFTLVQVREFAV
jgi:hypothetical protein